MPFNWVEQTAVFVLVSFLSRGTGLEPVHLAIQKSHRPKSPATGQLVFLTFVGAAPPRGAGLRARILATQSLTDRSLCRLHLLDYGEFRDDAGLDLDAFCERRERNAFIFAVHA